MTGAGAGGGRSLVLATRNDHKVREFARLLGGVEVLALPAGVRLPPETGETFADNALIKARAAAAATGAAAIADDSGIGAEALDWRPGVRSARFAGEQATDEENLARLEAEVPGGTRLRYTCVIALVEPGGAEHLFQGTCDGLMAPSRAGDGGFGYDPVFIPDAGDGRTMAQLSASEKDDISHRGRAARALLAFLLSAG